MSKYKYAICFAHLTERHSQVPFILPRAHAPYAFVFLVSCFLLRVCHWDMILVRVYPQPSRAPVTLDACSATGVLSGRRLTRGAK